MNRLRKILLGVVLQLSICVCLSLTAEAYDGDEHVTTPLNELNFEEKSGTWINPMCEDFGIEAEEDQNEIATYSNDAEKAVSYNASDYMSFDEALEYFKDGIKNRSENIAPFKFYMDQSLISDTTFLSLFDEDMKRHTGISTEGDVFIWEPMSASYSYEFAYDGTYFWVNITSYVPEYLTTVEQENETVNAIREEIKKLNLNGMSDYDKIYTIYDYICSHVTYDSENTSNGSGTNEGKKQAHSAYGAIINHKAVCQGYVLLMYRMLLEAGIDNRIVAGPDHAWNHVKLGDKYYYCDATWDAYNPEKTEANFSYFLCGTSDYRRNGSHHFIHDAEYIEKYPTPVYGYFSDKNNQVYLPNEVISSGVCGDSVEWKLTGDNTLTISGSGAISDYSKLEAPWNDVRERINHIVISDGVTRIGNYAFFDCYEMEDISIADTVTYIGDYAFSNCDHLESLRLPDSVTDTGINVCEKSVELKDIYFSKSLKQINEYFCSNCYSLTKVKIPDGVEEIGNSVFYACTGLTDVDIAGSVETIGMYAFCSAFPTKGEAILTLPNGIKEIQESAFYASNLTEINFPDSLQIIGRGAFVLSDRLTSIIIPKSVIKIENGAFSSCLRLQNIQLPDSDIQYEDGVFSRCDTLEEVYLPDSMEAIPDEMFRYDSALTYIHIPDNIHTIGKYAFEDSGLEEISISGNLEKIEDYAFSRTQLSKVLFKEKVTHLGESVFSWCENLKSVIFMDDPPEDIGEQCFYNTGAWCYYPENNQNWTEAIINSYGNSSSWYSYTIDEAGHMWPSFDYCHEPTCTEEGSSFCQCLLCDEKRIDEVYPAMGHDFQNGVCTRCGEKEDVQNSCGENLTWKLSDNGLLTISGNGKMDNYDSAKKTPWHDYADQIKEIIVEKGVTSIGNFAFYGLTDIKEITLPKGMEVVGDYAFKGCTSLESVELPKYLWKIGESAFYGCKSLKAMNMPDTITVMGAYAFKGCESMKFLHISNNLYGLNESAFYGCKSLTEIVVPEGIKRIDGYVFKNCSGVTKVELPSTLVKLGESAFYGCSSMTNMVIPTDVTSIGGYTFKNCLALEEITLPENLSTIGEAALYGCSNLKEIVIPDTVTKINSYTFKNCISLKNVKLSEAMTKISESCFYGCTSLENLVLPDSVTNIDAYAFRKCSSLENVEFSSELTAIGESAFYGCEALTSITVPEKVTSIEAYAFKSCTGVKEVTLPESLETIGDSAFYGCTGMTKLVIPCNVQTVGAYAFSKCAALTSIVFTGDAPAIGDNAFSKVISEVYYPSENDTWTEDVMQNYGGTLTWLTDEIVSDDQVSDNEDELMMPETEIIDESIVETETEEPEMDSEMNVETEVDTEVEEPESIEEQSNLFSN